jgi:hypothetical protein
MRWIALTLLWFARCSIVAAAECPASGSTIELFGIVGKGLGISMNLTVQKDRLSGSYLYVKYEKKIPLSGTCTNGSLALQESDASGKQTGSFRGNFTKPQIIEGTWSTPDGKKTLPFHLQALLPTDRVSGRYTQPNPTCDTEGGKTVIEPDDELNILLQDDGRLRIAGISYYVTNTCYVNLGTVDGTAKLEGRTADYVVDPDDPHSCRVTIQFTNGTLDVSDDCLNRGPFGHNVEFAGTYKRVGPPTFQEALQ